MMQVYTSNIRPVFWDEFMSRHSPMLFNRSTWAQVLMDGYGGEPLYCWLMNNDQPAVAMLGAIMDFKVVRIVYSTIPYGGVVGDESVLNQFITGLEPLLHERDIHLLHIVEPRHFPSLEELGFQPVEVARHMVDLEGMDPDSYFKALPHAVRKNLSKSKREGVEIRPIPDRESIREVFDLYLQTMARNAAAAKYPIGRFFGIYDHLVSRGLGIILGAYHDGKMIGTNTLVSSDDTVHDIQLSYDHAYQQLRPTDALVHASVEWTLGQGRRYFDFMGSPANDSSLEQFKAKWLAQRTTTCTYIKAINPIRAQIWKIIQKAASHPAGAWFIRRLRK